MPDARIFRVEGFEQTDLPLAARVLKDGAAITQSDISSISVTVRRYARNGGEVSTSKDATTINKTTTVFDTLQTGALWTKDTIGYNFLYAVPAAAFPGPDAYSIVFTFTPASGSPFRVVFRANMASLQGI